MSVFLHSLANYGLNALWQAALLCAAAWITARMMRPLGPRAEHRVWVIALVAQCLLPACAVPGLAAWLWHWIASGGRHAGNVTVTMGVAEPVNRGEAGAMFVPFALAIWAAVTLAIGVRVVLQMWRLRGLRRDALPAMLDDATTVWMREACSELGVARVDVLSSAKVNTPLTFGLLRPVLLLPQGFAERVAARDLRAALAHELAHVARRDAAKQMLYCAMTLPLAWHPAVRFALTQIAETRERVCDSVAAEITGGARQYARSLLELASLLTVRRPAHAHAIGLFDANQLERRVLMLNRRVFPVARSLRAGLIAGSGVLAIAACTSALALRIDAPEQPATEASGQAKPQGPVRISSSVAAGQVIHKVTPVYPPDAKKAHISGAVVLKAIIGKDGSVQNLQVVSGPEALQASALDAVRQWVYKPYLLNGEPTAVETNITVNYSFAEEPQSAPAPESPSASTREDVPRVISQVDAVYPPEAKQAKMSGEVVVSMLVDRQGRVSDVAALSGPEVFRQAAIDAVRQYTFSPAMRNGEAVPASMRVSVNFQTF